SYNVQLQLLPNFNRSQDLDRYVDEADQFYANPLKFLDDHFEPVTIPSSSVNQNGTLRRWPSHLVIFEALLKDLGSVLSGYDYVQFNGIFLTHLLIRRLRSSIDPKSYTPILKFFNTFTLESNIYPFRPCISMLVVHVLNPSRIPGHTIHWLLSFIRDEALWLLQDVDRDTASSQAPVSENISSFLSEQFSK
ncbi:3247_t:CDS:2, partial [Acaulospora colombiana]